MYKCYRLVLLLMYMLTYRNELFKVNVNVNANVMLTLNTENHKLLRNVLRFKWKAKTC